MSTHPIPSPAGDPEDSIRWQRWAEVKRLCHIYLRDPEGFTDVAGTISLVFTPDLTAPQTAILNRLIVLSGILRITPQEWQAIEADIALAKAFLAIPAPTLAQNSAGTKSLIRIVAALIRS